MTFKTSPKGEINSLQQHNKEQVQTRLGDMLITGFCTPFCAFALTPLPFGTDVY